jgi:hypothetical protein
MNVCKQQKMKVQATEESPLLTQSLAFTVFKEQR